MEKVRKVLEVQCKEMAAKLEEAEANSQKGGKRVVQKLEQRVNNLCFRNRFVQFLKFVITKHVILS